MANTANKIVKTWAIGDHFLAADQESLNKGTINKLVDDNDLHHVLISGTGTFSIKAPNNTASGYASIAVGDGNNVSGNYSMGVNGGNNVSGNYSMGGGNGIDITGDNSFALGSGCDISANYGAAFGVDNTITANGGLAAGDSNTINGIYSAIIGARNSTINSAHHNSVILGGNGLLSKSSNTTHVNKLNINSILTDDTLGEVLAVDNNGLVNNVKRNWYGYMFIFEQDMSVSTTTSNVWQDKLKLKIPTGAILGTYEIESNAGYYGNSTARDYRSRITIDGVQYKYLSQEPQQGGNTQNSQHSMRYYYVLSDNTVDHIVLLQYTSETLGTQVGISEANLSAKLVKKA